MTPWATGDLVSIACALIYLPMGLMIQLVRSTAPGCCFLLTIGMSVGIRPLVATDPMRQPPWLKRSFPAIALTEGRAALSWRMTCALIYPIRDVFRRPTAVLAR